MNNISEQFADRIYDMSNMNIPEKTIQQAKKCFIDYIAVTLAGSSLTNKTLQDYIKRNPGGYHLVGLADKTDINSAVLINAYNSHILELDDGHRVGMMHLAAPIFSGLISVAEQEDCTVNDIIKGAVAGYEAAIRLASAIQPNHKKKGFHATGTCGTVGVALGISVMLGYTRQEMMNVLSAAATSGAGLLEVITGKSQQKPYNISNAAVSGMNAALFGRCFCGPSDVIGGNRGFIENFSDTYDVGLLTKETDYFEIDKIYMKPYAACRHCHAPIEAALKVGVDCNIDIDEIEEIVIDTYGLAVFGHDHNNIEGINSAKMSIPYSVAAALTYHKAGLEMFTYDMVRDDKILSLAKKVVVNEDEELSKLVPDKRAAVITVKLKNGKKESLRVDYPKGEPENPIEYNELIEKFYSLAETAGYSRKQSDVIVNCIENKGSISIKELLNCFGK